MYLNSERSMQYKIHHSKRYMQYKNRLGLELENVNVTTGNMSYNQS